MSTHPNIEDMTSELNTSKKRYNSMVKAAICTTNSKTNNKKPKALYKHGITLAAVLTERREPESEGFRHECSHCVTRRRQ